MKIKGRLRGRGIKASEELYGALSVTLSMPKSQVLLPAPAPLLPSDSLTCTDFSAARQLPVAPVLHAGTGHPQRQILS